MIIKKGLTIWLGQAILVLFLCADFVLLYQHPFRQVILLFGVSLLTMACLWESDRHKDYLVIPFAGLTKFEKLLRIARWGFIALLICVSCGVVWSLCNLDIPISLKTTYINGLKSLGATLGLMVNALWRWRMAYAVVAYWGIHSLLWVVYNNLI